MDEEVLMKREIIADNDNNFINNKKNMILKRMQTIKKLEKLYSIDIRKHQNYTSRNYNLNKNNSIRNKKHKRTESQIFLVKNSLINSPTNNNYKSLNNKNFTSLYNQHNNLKLKSNNSTLDNQTKHLKKSGTLNNNQISNPLSNSNSQRSNNRFTTYVNQKINEKKILFEHRKKNNFYREKIIDNPLEIPEEDKIFEEMNELNKRKSIFSADDKGIKNFNLTNGFDSNSINKKYFHKRILSQGEKMLNNVYKISPLLIRDLNKAKRKKVDLDLYSYQENLLNTLNEKISKDNLLKLKEKFIDLRIFSKTSYEEKDDYYFIKNIEKKEKFFEHILYRQHVTYDDEGNFFKNLNLLNRNVKNIIIVDDTFKNFKNHKLNGICIKPFYGDIYNDKNTLKILGSILYRIRYDADITGDIRISLSKERNSNLYSQIANNM